MTEISPQDFRKHCQLAAERFLQTVVIIDNQAQLYENETSRPVLGTPQEPKKLKKPVSGLSKPEINERKTNAPSRAENEELQGHDMEPESHALRAWIVTEKFADRGVLCSVYRPADHGCDRRNDEDNPHATSDPVVARSSKMAKLADVVVLDWELNDAGHGDKGTWKAREIIQNILSNDDKINGRQRLIAVYTATPELAGVYKDIQSDLADLNLVGGYLVCDEKNLSFTNKTTRIVLFNKATRFTSEYDHRTVSEEMLSDRLMEEFVELNAGLFPSIALHSIAAVREATHHMLATFGKELDPALVSHRSQLPNPKDAEDFALDLIAGEMRSALSLNKVGEEYANHEVYKLWIANKMRGNAFFRLSEHVSMTQEEAFRLVLKGQEEFDRVWRASAKRWVEAQVQKNKPFKHRFVPGRFSRLRVTKLIEGESMKTVRANIESIQLLDFKQLTGLFANDSNAGALANSKLARLSSLKRESYGSRHLPESWLPKLMQGSILRKIEDDLLTDQYFICTQPRCDCVRLRAKTNFSFLALEIKKQPVPNKQLLIVKSKNLSSSKVEDTKLWINPTPKFQKSISFSPIEPQDFIQAKFDENQGYYFENSNCKFEWIADMQDPQAQRICDHLSGRQGSVGIDEFEWQRQFSQS